jgi:hypothetical protein
MMMVELPIVLLTHLWHHNLIDLMGGALALTSILVPSVKKVYFQSHTSKLKTTTLKTTKAMHPQPI